MNKIHGHARNGAETRTYRIWHGMMRRCYEAGHKDYPSYGGRGIAVTARWHNFVNFLADMGECPDGHSIDRLDNAVGYEPANCRWATPGQQARNRTNTVFVVIDGQRMVLKDAARLRGIPYRTVHDRISRGWTVERALS